MPRFVSIMGKFYPEKERVVLKNTTNNVLINPSAEYSKYAGEEVQPGAEFIYEGPCRKAMTQLYKEGLEYYGQDFRKSPDFLEVLRKFNFKNDKEYFKFYGIDVEKEVEQSESRIAKITSHELPSKVEAIQKIGGGIDTSGQGNERYGGFGLPKELT